LNKKQKEITKLDEFQPEAIEKRKKRLLAKLKRHVKVLES